MAVMLILFSLLISMVEGRVVRLYSDDHDLISDGMEKSELSSSPCSHQYGFMPCAENAFGYFFLVVVYQLLLAVGGWLTSSGSEVLFNIIGAGRVGGILFRILMVLPSMTLMILSGVFGSKEEAQSQVSVGVGIYAGITVFSLTIQWSTCMNYSKSDLKNTNGIGVQIDKKTCYIAGIMLLSLIPYIVLLLDFVFGSAYEKRVITLVALGISSLSLLSYFIYQIWDPWMQTRSLIYSRLDVDLHSFDKRHYSTTTEEEFMEEFRQWALEAENMGQQIRTLSQKDQPETMDKIMAKFLKHTEAHLLKYESLITVNLKPNMERIHEVFEQIDTDRSNTISSIELKQVITAAKFGLHQLNEERALDKMFQEFDTDHNQEIDEHEFTYGLEKYLNKAIQTTTASPSGFVGKKVLDEFDRIASREANAEADYGKKALIVSLSQVVVGFVLLGFLGSPLMANILQLSHAIGFPSPIISFVVVPLAMNARSAISAILPASKKSEETASWTFSEIYSGVIMNNMAGLTILLAIVYAKDLTWDFSAEVLTVLVVCGTIGTLGFLRTTYYPWTGTLAVILYVLAVGFICFYSSFL